MPIFEYKCSDCGRVSEFLVISSAEKVDIKCKNCGGRKVEKIFSTSNVGKNNSKEGKTCCGREERCDKPPCGGGGCVR